MYQLAVGFGKHSLNLGTLLSLSSSVEWGQEPLHLSGTMIGPILVLSLKFQEQMDQELRVFRDMQLYLKLF